MQSSCSIALQIPESFHALANYVSQLKLIFKETGSSYSVRLLTRAYQTLAAGYYQRQDFKNCLSVCDECIAFCKQTGTSVNIQLELIRYLYCILSLFADVKRILAYSRLGSYKRAFQLLQASEAHYEVPTALKETYRLLHVQFRLFLRLPVQYELYKDLDIKHPFSDYISKSLVVQLEHVELCIGSNDLKLAESHLERIAECYPDVWWLWERLGDLYRRIREEDKSNEAYQHALKVYKERVSTEKGDSVIGRLTGKLK